MTTLQNTPYVLAIDNGTQSVRALIFDLEGQLIAKSKVPIEAYFSVNPGWAEQQPTYYWDKLCQACQELWRMIDFPISQIRAVALTTQRATVVNLDRQGNPLRPAIVWLDQRRVDDLPPMNGLWDKLIKVSGNGDTLNYFRSQAECNWMARHQPDIWKHTHKYLLLSGYHTYKLTGRYVDSVASQVGYLPFDFKHFRWARRADWKWQALTIRRQQ